MHGPFGEGNFGRNAERFARFFGTPRFIIGQTMLVTVWIALNAAAVSLRWDPYPFILLNLAFSTQAAYAAPLILLAQTRQAERDKLREDAFQLHREDEAARSERSERMQETSLAEDRELNAQQVRMAEQHAELLRQNTVLTEQVARLTTELHAAMIPPPARG
jgi:Predicted membrane protein